MQELTKRTEVQNKIRFLNDNKIPYDIYIGKYFKEDCIIIDTLVIDFSIHRYFYDIDNGKLIMNYIINKKEN